MVEILEGEVWKETKHPGYWVSNLGRASGRRGGILKPKTHTNGYLRISPGLGNTEYLHILVLEAFAGRRPSPLHEVDHINHDRSDNRLENLRWVSVADNRMRRKTTRLSPEIIREIRTSPERRVLLAEKFGITVSYVKQIRAREKWKSVA